MPTRILITDDHGVMRAGLRAMLEDEPGIEVVGEASTGEAALELSNALLPDLVLLDIGMPGMDGIEITRRIKKALPQIKVLILTVYEDESLLREAIKAGASGYVTKRAAEEELTAAIKASMRGDLYIHPAVTRMLLNDLSPAVHSTNESLELLSTRELEILGYIVRGYTNRQIAETLYLSIRTVEGHRANLYSKLGLKNRVELVEFAEKFGLRNLSDL